MPAELSIVGLDDNPDAAFYRPALTTVRLDIAGEAARCIAEVLGVAAPDAPASPVLIARASSGKAAAVTAVARDRLPDGCSLSSNVTGNMI